jgi:hypothetical protein
MKYSPKYWVVNQDDSSNQHKGQEEPHCTSKSEYLTRVEDEEEEQRFDDEPNVVALDAELEHDENTEWLRGYEWLVWLLTSLSISLSQLQHCRPRGHQKISYWACEMDLNV